MTLARTDEGGDRGGDNEKEDGAWGWPCVRMCYVLIGMFLSIYLMIRLYLEYDIMRVGGVGGRGVGGRG